MAAEDASRMRFNAAVAVTLLAVAGYFFAAAGALPFGTARVPQSAFFPKIIAALLAILSSILLVQTLRGGGERAASEKIALAMFGMALYAMALERLGFLLSTFLLTGFLLRVMEPQSWSKLLTLALATALGSYAIFARALGMPLPPGILGF
jgi:hypothetical protein